MRVTRNLLIGLSVVLTLAAGADGREMELARVDRTIEVKAQPTQDSETVVTALEGDRFEIVATIGEWWQVQLFHDSYFLPRSAATEMVEMLRIPEGDDRRKEIFRDIYLAEERALKDAERAAAMDGKTSADERTRKFLIERAKLEVARQHGLSVPAAVAIAFEGADAGWPVH